ncbi:GNAT family N-acetyltransferase [Acetoanaerobium sticklandii]|uniref:GNAT family N-acetyltransferase n=1 Tax=Acetoanaerobium sticklandii TaxID=1511 RepID=UPI003A8D0329
MIELSKIKFEDIDFLFNARNTPEIYKYLFNPNPVSLEDHKAWIKSAIEHEKPIFVIKYNEESVGMIQVNSLDKVVEVGLYVLPSYSGKGIASKALDKLKDYLKINEVEEIVARVLNENNASKKFFENNDFKISEVVYKYKI